MTYTMMAQEPKKFLSEFCGITLREYFRDILTGTNTVKKTPEQIDELLSKTRPETFLLAAFVSDWYDVRRNRSAPFFFKSGRWFWYPERRVALPAEALPGLLFTGKHGILDFDYVHSDWNDLTRSENVGRNTVHDETQGRFRNQIAPLLELGMDFDKAVWQLAKAQYPVHVFNAAKEEMWCIDFWFCYVAFKELSEGSKSLDGKVKI